MTTKQKMVELEKFLLEVQTQPYQAIRKAYLTALARERQDLYKTNFDLDALR